MLYRIVRIVLFITAVTTALLVLNRPSQAAPYDPIDTWDIIDRMDDSSDGMGFYYGFKLKEVDGPILYGFNTNGINGTFYPASTVKVLHHLHALRWAEANGWEHLIDPIPYYNPSCETPPSNVAGTKALSNTLWEMMFDSNNVKTNAVQDYFGQAAINDTAHNVVGMSGWTQLNHKLGCGGPDNNPANQMILDDIVLLYERYAQGQLLNLDGMYYFEALMRNEVNSNFLNGLINVQSSSLGLTEAQEQEFRDHFNLAYKGGSYGQDTNGDEIEDISWRSIAGFVELPTKTCGNKIETRAYAFGAFVDEATSLTDPDLTGNVVRDMLTGEMRNSLQSFKGRAVINCVSNWLTITSGNGGTLPIPDAVGGTMRLDVGVDSTQITTLRLEVGDSSDMPPTPPRMRFTGHGFVLNAVEDGLDVAWQLPVGSLLTIEYNDDDVRLVNEDQLQWYWWDGRSDMWRDVTGVCGGEYGRFPRENKLTAPACEMGQYALFGPDAATH